VLFVDLIEADVFPSDAIPGPPVIETSAARDHDQQPSRGAGPATRLEEKVDRRLLEDVVDVLVRDPITEFRDLPRFGEYGREHSLLGREHRRRELGPCRIRGGLGGFGHFRHYRPVRPLRYAAGVGAGLVFEDVSKVYPGARGTVALDGIDLTIPAGQFVAVVGPSGCGKSTLLHLSGGIDLPTRGRVLADGRDITGFSERELTLFRRRSVGVVFQFFNLIPALTVIENVELPLLLDGARDSPQRARELLARVGVADKEDAYPYELSGGQTQRVAIARALVHRPSLLLADEPTGNLDSASGGAVLDLIARLPREEGATVLLATHSDEASARAERRVRLRDGRLE